MIIRELVLAILVVAATVLGQWLIEAPQSGGDGWLFLRHTLGVWTLVGTGMVYQTYRCKDWSR